MKIFQLSSILIIVYACGSKNPQSEETQKKVKTVGEIIMLDQELGKIIDANAKLEVLSEGYDWSEGPLWLPQQQKLIWSDVPRNTIYAWSEGDSVSILLSPSGYTSDVPRPGETGSNGLLLDGNGKLILCQHGNRSVARMVSDLDNPQPLFMILAGSYDGKKFSSPNDAAYGPNGNLYFTDPPYGLMGQDEDPEKEMNFNGVYRLSPKGEVSVMTKSLTRPNGIAFNPDKTKCYVANSDDEYAVWMVYDVDGQGNLINEKLFFDATSMVKEGNGLPDGLKVNKEGILFATGPGGLLIFTPQGNHLGTLHTGSPVSNCALNDDESILFMTSDAMIVKVDLLRN